MAFEPSKHVNGRMWPPGVSGLPEWQTCWQSHRIQPKLSERPSLGLGRAWSRRHGKDGKLCSPGAVGLHARSADRAEKTRSQSNIIFEYF